MNSSRKSQGTSTGSAPRSKDGSSAGYSAGCETGSRPGSAPGTGTRSQTRTSTGAATGNLEGNLCINTEKDIGFLRLGEKRVLPVSFYFPSNLSPVFPSNFPAELSSALLAHFLEDILSAFRPILARSARLCLNSNFTATSPLTSRKSTCSIPMCIDRLGRNCIIRLCPTKTRSGRNR